MGNPDLEPTAKWIKSFFRLLVRERPGIIGERLAVQTLSQYAISLGTVLSRTRKSQLPWLTNEQVTSVSNPSLISPTYTRSDAH
jgi:hypothetical protein